MSGGSCPAVLLRLFPVLPGLPVCDVDKADRAHGTTLRALNRIAPCQLCDERSATVVLVVGASDLVGAARWLDCCFVCLDALRDVAADMIGGLYNDADLLRWYAEWETTAGSRNG